MPRMLIVSSASIRSGSSNDHMSGTLNVCMFQKPVIVAIYSGFYRLFILKALRLLCILFYWALSSQMHIGNDVPFLVLPISC